MKLKFFILMFAIATLNAFGQQKKKDESLAKPAAERIVLISTDMGEMKVKLYNSTPLHRDNFIKLAEQGFYDSLIFHRVIKNFMIQGGDPESRDAAPGVQLGNGSVNYLIPAEFNDSLFHKKGALAAARTENPEKASSGCQFYIVQGNIFSDADLERNEQNINNGFRKQELFQVIINRPENSELKNKFITMQQANQRDSLNALINTTIVPMIDAEFVPFKYSEYQKNTYKSIGGTPHLDQGYTVFGEVIEGLDVIDRIAGTATGTADRPLQDIRMKIKVIQ